MNQENLKEYKDLKAILRAAQLVACLYDRFVETYQSGIKYLEAYDALAHVNEKLFVLEQRLAEAAIQLALDITHTEGE